MNARSLRRFKTIGLCTALVAGTLLRGAFGQAPPPPTTLPTSRPVVRFDAGLQGRNVEQIRVAGNTQTSASVILNAVRTREGEPFDAATVEEDYQRVFNLRRFSNVEAKVEPTANGGVVVVFIVTEQKTITAISYLGNVTIDTPKIIEAVDIREGEAIDRFRIALAKQGIERLYKEKNYPFSSVTVDETKLASTGELIFNIVEGPNVRIRKVTFPGSQSFDRDVLLDQIKSKSWIWIFRSGTLDFETLEDDVGALRRFYDSKGFFDARVGRRLRFSADLSEVQIDFVIDEGQRYVVDKVEFTGLKLITKDQAMTDLKLKAGDYFDNEIVQRDIRQIVRTYSPSGLIYQPSGEPNPDYLHIQATHVIKREPGKVDLVYQIEEGKQFRMGRVLVKGNTSIMDKTVLREIRLQPGQTYDSGELTDAVERIKATPYFQNATVTPIGDDPNYRDVLVEVQERQYRSFSVGAGVNSNGGVGGNLTFEHRNFDIGQYPTTPGDLFTDRAFTGAGQRFRATLEPGTEFSSASVLFSEPYLFDSPYSLTTEAYYRDRTRPDWRETRLGARVSIGRRLGYENEVRFSLRAEDVEVWDIDDAPLRAPEVLKYSGHTFLTTYGLTFRRDTTNRGAIPYKGYTFTASTEQAAPPGEVTFNKLGASWDQYFTVGEDLLDRKTVFAIHADTGYIFGNAPFFEQFYGGGIGSIRGFKFRGVSPRSGLEDDPIGGKFATTVSGELSYPLAGNFLRGVVFADTGTVEPTFELGTYRVAVGTGFRLYLPFFGSAPFALDFAVPLTKDSQDDTQLISFSFGFNP